MVTNKTIDLLISGYMETVENSLVNISFWKGMVNTCHLGIMSSYMSQYKCLDYMSFEFCMENMSFWEE